MFFNDLRKGFALTFKYLFKKPVTENYPYEKIEMPERARWLHRFYPDKCIMCKLCENICPPKCIAVGIGKNPEGKRELRGYDIKIDRCIFCGLCVEVCPTKAITMTDVHEFADSNRNKFHFNMEQLSHTGEEEQKKVG